MALRRIACCVTVVAALAAATPAFGQRLSLAERVTLIENQLNAQNQGAGQANLELQNRVVQLTAEVQALRNEVEMLRNEVEQLRQRQREQYVDLDSRLARLEGGAPAAPAAGSAGATAPAKPSSPPATPAREPAPTSTAAASDPAAAEAAYQAALDTLVERFEPAESARLFRQFITDFPDSTLIPNAWYWLGESYYVTQNYELGVEAFQSLLVQHPGSRKEADALLKLAYCQIALGQSAEGEASLREVIARHPGTDAAAKAEGRLRELASGR
ncbi:tol-pal system protein YbgF [Arenimonas fontis]|uniref:Cell division coordinator CpoB n=1 Tax=Arenimonas fontis TaxID=2608255 RepID=A0A5B2Z9R7_9GAMM|nr:tol-pal system protein YbgF [Arenimonas fontis]KAA2284896.1 tol-pal system protein YbgF [Arenimonas fontis]